MNKKGEGLGKQYLNPINLPKWDQSFSQVVVASGEVSKTIYLSGQVSVDRDNKIVGEGSLKAQAERAFENLETALEAAGAMITDVVKLNIYVKNYQPADAELIRNAMRGVFCDPPLPASTWIGVETLALEGLLIEVEAIAVV
jgi:enamine deaminase RidA (YjgF/YER057c/UK114 family)